VTVGLICAIDQEIAHLRNALKHHHTEVVAHASFDHGRLDGHEVVVAGAGIGKVNAAVVATMLADRFGCRTIVFSGVAGGLDPALQIGDVVIADRTVQHDAGVIKDARAETYQAGHLPFINPTDQLGHPVDPELLQRVKNRLDGFTLPPLSTAAGGHDRPPRIAYGTVLTDDQFLLSETVRDRLHQELGGLAIEMEGGAVAQVCDRFGVPWLVIRALSDLAGRESGFDFNTFVADVAASSAAILRHLLPVL
jgi:adenosylhomocysteine nucleosidase